MPSASYEIPRYGSGSASVLGWCLEAEQEGRGWLQAQRPTQGWENALQMLSAPDGDDDAAVNQGSKVGYNKGKRIARELVASLANFRHEGRYKPRWDNTLYDRAHILSNLDENWYNETFANEDLRKGLQYAVGTGTAYLYETWDKHYWGAFRGDIRLQALSPADVTFVQLPKDHNIQRAYAVIIREEMPINLARAVYGETNQAFAASLVPDQEQPGWLSKGMKKLQQFVSPALRVAGRTDPKQQTTFPSVDIFHMYVLDRSLNDGPTPIQMGVNGTNWSYTVPALGDPIPTAITNPATGNFFTVPATAEHCKLFPLRRYVIFSRTGICYDGSSPWWHGQAPLARLTFNDWAWEALGSSLVGEVKTMQEGIVALMRLVEDSGAARLDPPMIYDDQMAQSWAEAVNPRKAGARAKAPLSTLAEPIKPVLPPQYYDVPAWIPEWIVGQEARMDYVTSVTDLVAISKAKQIPGADTLEKLMEMAGPIVQDLVRRLEKPLTQLGEWRKAYYYQFYTRQRVLTITGKDGNPEDVLYKPEQLIPLGTPGETPEAYALRGRGYLDDFKYEITESGINEIHRMSMKLFYLQLMKLGYPIDWWTFSEIAQIPNFGAPPDGTNTVMERWVAQKRIETDLAISQQEQVAAAMPQQPQPPGAGPSAPGGQPPPNGQPGQVAQSGPGRPNTFAKPPRLEQKDGGSRTTIATS